MICKISPSLKFNILWVFLTHWLMMTKILFRILRICCSLFKGYLKNENISLNFMFLFLESSSNYKHFLKNWLSWLMRYRNHTLSNTWLEHCSKSAVLKLAFRVNMLKGLKRLWGLHESNLIKFFIILRRHDLENISLIEILKLRSLCQHIDCQWQVCCLGLWDAAVPYSKGVIFKTKNVVWILC